MRKHHKVDLARFFVRGCVLAVLIYPVICVLGMLVPGHWWLEIMAAIAVYCVGLDRKLIEIIEEY